MTRAKAFTKKIQSDFLLVLLFLTPAFPASAKDAHVIQQKDHQFSELFLKMKNDDVLKFVNMDNVKHRLVFSHKGKQEVMNSIKPGTTQEVTFSQSGLYDVQCQHHPEMKLTIFIPYPLNSARQTAIYKF